MNPQVLLNEAIQRIHDMGVLGGAAVLFGGFAVFVFVLLYLDQRS